MAALILTGPTLGARHKELNLLVNTAISKKIPFEDINKSEGVSDVDVLYKIDIAAKCRNLEYIIQTLKSEDIFYVSSAIKRSTWLINEKQYEHIVNPDNLYRNLFPFMTSKAQHKFLLHVRLYIKDEGRAEQFYRYYINEKQPTTAVKWLPYCSVSLIQEQIVLIIDHLDVKLIARLIERSFIVLALYQTHHKGFPWEQIYQTGLIWLNDKTEELLDIYDTLEDYWMPKFSAKQTKCILRKCPHRIIDKFKKYFSVVSLKEVGKHIGKENIRNFLFKYATTENEEMFKYDSLKDLIKLMPDEGKWEFIRYMFVDKKYLKQTTTDEIPAGNFVLQRSLYGWYRHTPFDVAFSEIMKLVRTESSPGERMGMLSLLVSCAKQNLNDVMPVIKYYHDRHINEPYKYKSQFVHTVIRESPTYRFNESGWTLLDNLFRSMEVYLESDNNVQSCLEVIIMYKLLHNQPIPEMIERKFRFSTMKYCLVKSDIDKNEREVIFNYLYNITKAKINVQNINNTEQCTDIIESLNDIVTLLTDWSKDVTEYPFVLESFINIIKLVKEKEMDVSLVVLIDKYKIWRQHLFEYSLMMSPDDEVCLHVLKHDPGMFSRYQTEMDKLRCESAQLDRLHKKIRIYWPVTTSEWISSYRGWLQQSNTHKAVVRALCLLLSQTELTEFVEQYKPSNAKIHLSSADEHLVSLQSNISKQMYVARPQPSPELVMPYVEGDFLQYAFSSLNAIFSNISSNKCRIYIFNLLGAPIVSVQKYGIRIVYSKLKQEEILQIYLNTWRKTKIASIRAVIFQFTYRSLCKENDENKAKNIWEVLSKFIDELGDEPNKDIYSTFKNVDEVPFCVRAAFCVKSYNFLKSLPSNADRDSHVHYVAVIAGALMEIIDPQFVHGIIVTYSQYSLQEQLKDRLISDVFKNVLSDYLLYAKDEKTQLQRYNETLVPFTNRVFEKWNEHEDYRNLYWNVINNITGKLKNHLVIKDLVVPVAMYTDIQNKIAEKLSDTLYKEYKRTTSLKIITHVLSILDKETYERHEKKIISKSLLNENTLWEKAINKVLPKIAESINQILKNDVQHFFPSIYGLFKKAVNEAFINLRTGLLKSPLFAYNEDEWQIEPILNLCEALLPYSDNVRYMLIIKLLPKYLYQDSHITQSKKVQKVIAAHPSVEVKMHFYKRFLNSNY